MLYIMYIVHLCPKKFAIFCYCIFASCNVAILFSRRCILHYFIYIKNTIHGECHNIAKIFARNFASSSHLAYLKSLISKQKSIITECCALKNDQNVVQKPNYDTLCTHVTGIYTIDKLVKRLILSEKNFNKICLNNLQKNS